MIDIETPDLSAVRGYRGLHALCTIRKKGELKASHFASVLIGGPKPVWGVWSARTGKFVRYAASRTQIEESYPHLTWRRVMMTWQPTDTTHKTLPVRRAELTEIYGGTLPDGT